jgi:hypothetical protein
MKGGSSDLELMARSERFADCPAKCKPNKGGSNFREGQMELLLWTGDPPLVIRKCVSLLALFQALPQSRYWWRIIKAAT